MTTVLPSSSSPVPISVSGDVIREAQSTGSLLAFVAPAFAWS